MQLQLDILFNILALAMAAASLGMFADIQWDLDIAAEQPSRYKIIPCRLFVSEDANTGRVVPSTAAPCSASLFFASLGTLSLLIVILILTISAINAVMYNR